MSIVKITIPQGTASTDTVRFEVIGGSGATCLTEHERLRQSIGRTIARQLKPEFHQKNHAKNSQQQHA